MYVNLIILTILSYTVPETHVLLVGASDLDDFSTLVVSSGKLCSKFLVNCACLNCEFERAVSLFNTQNSILS
jgi:hypothetical protein